MKQGAVTNTLSRYIFKKAMLMWVSALLCFVLLVMVSRLFGDISMFAEHDTDMLTVSRFMLYSIPQVIYWVLPFSICLGILAAQSSFSRNSEVIAMQACAVSNPRIYLPYIFVGIIAAVGMSIVSFHAYPLAQRQADRIEDVYIKHRDVHGEFSVSGGRFKAGDYIFYVQHLDIDEGLMNNVVCYRIDSGQIMSVIKTPHARWDGNSWRCEEMQATGIAGGNMTFDTGPGTIPFARGPEELVMAQPRPEVLTIGELEQYIDNIASEGIRSFSTETYFHSRISFSVAPLIMTILVLPFGMRFPRTGGIARGIAAGLVLGLLYWSLHSGMVSLGCSGRIPPVVAAWTANLAALLTGLLALLFRRGSYG